jgi:hypothetical protein
LPKYACKRLEIRLGIRSKITHGVRYRNALCSGTIYANLSGIRN